MKYIRRLLSNPSPWRSSSCLYNGLCSDRISPSEICFDRFLNLYHRIRQKLGSWGAIRIRSSNFQGTSRSTRQSILRELIAFAGLWIERGTRDIARETASQGRRSWTTSEIARYFSREKERRTNRERQWRVVLLRQQEKLHGHNKRKLRELDKKESTLEEGGGKCR